MKKEWFCFVTRFGKKNPCDRDDILVFRSKRIYERSARPLCSGNPPNSVGKEKSRGAG